MLDANIKAKKWQRDSETVLTDICDQFASNELCQYIDQGGFSAFKLHRLGNLSEWLRRKIRNLLGFARAGSSPAVVVNFLFLFHPQFFLTAASSDTPPPRASTSLFFNCHEAFQNTPVFIWTCIKHSRVSYFVTILNDIVYKMFT